MRTFKVWLRSAHYGRNIPTETETIEMPDDATDAECDKACRECLEAMIGNTCETGWEEQS